MKFILLAFAVNSFLFQYNGFLARSTFKERFVLSHKFIWVLVEIREINF